VGYNAVIGPSLYSSIPIHLSTSLLHPTHRSLNVLTAASLNMIQESWRKIWEDSRSSSKATNMIEGGGMHYQCNRGERMKVHQSNLAIQKLRLPLMVLPLYRYRQLNHWKQHLQCKFPRRWKPANGTCYFWGLNDVPLCTRDLRNLELSVIVST